MGESTSGSGGPAEKPPRPDPIVEEASKAIGRFFEHTMTVLTEQVVTLGTVNAPRPLSSTVKELTERMMQLLISNVEATLPSGSGPAAATKAPPEDSTAKNDPASGPASS